MTDMNFKFTLGAMAAGAGLLLAAGCSSGTPSGFASGPPALPASPTGRVASNRLPPPPPPPPPANDMNANNGMGANGDMNAGGDMNNGGMSGNGGITPNGGGSQVASLGNNNGANGGGNGGGGSLSRNSVLGAYKVTTTGGNCQIILSLTKWTGGYRAASRGCPGAVSDVTAWDVSGNSVVLKDSNGSQIASLASSGGARYEGTTSSGQPITLYR